MKDLLSFIAGIGGLVGLVISICLMASLHRGEMTTLALTPAGCTAVKTLGGQVLDKNGSCLSIGLVQSSGWQNNYALSQENITITIGHDQVAGHATSDLPEPALSHAQSNQLVLAIVLLILSGLGVAFFVAWLDRADEGAARCE